jgi:excisionase family DNA binding protein
MSASIKLPTNTEVPRIEAAYFTVAHAAAYTSLSLKTIRRMLSSGKLTAYRPTPGCVRLARAELDNVMRASANGRPKRRPA